MGFERSNHEQDICNLGETYDRSICMGQQSQTANILFVDSVPESIRNRRSVNSMEQHGSICHSSNLPGSQSPGTYVAVPSSDHSNSTTVAQETLVHKPVTKSNRLYPRRLPILNNLLHQPKQEYIIPIQKCSI